MKIPKLRWVIAFLLCLSTLINYLDRQAIGVVSVDIRREFSLNEQDYSHILTLFFLAYALCKRAQATSSTGEAPAAVSRFSSLAGPSLNCCTALLSVSGAWGPAGFCSV